MTIGKDIISNPYIPKMKLDKENKNKNKNFKSAYTPASINLIKIYTHIPK